MVHLNALKCSRSGGIANYHTNKSYNLPFLVVKLGSAGDSGADQSSLAGTRPVRFPHVVVGTNRTVCASWTASSHRCRCVWPTTLAQSCANRLDIAAVGDSRAVQGWPGMGRWPAIAVVAAVDYCTGDRRRPSNGSPSLGRRSFASHSGCYL